MPTEILSLKDWQRRRLFTVRSLAEAAGVSALTVVQLGAGQRTPRTGTIRALSAALGVEPDQVREFRAAMGFPVDDEESGDEG